MFVKCAHADGHFDSGFDVVIFADLGVGFQFGQQFVGFLGGHFLEDFHEVIDGIPNENGFFPDEAMQRPAPFTQDEYAMIQTARRTQADPPDWLALKIQDHQIWGSRRGRIFYKAIPAVMGSWMLDAGFIHGLTVKAMGDASAVNTFASIVWMPFGKRK